jgi:hypothetical protein
LIGSYSLCDHHYESIDRLVAGDSKLPAITARIESTARSLEQPQSWVSSRTLKHQAVITMESELTCLSFPAPKKEKAQKLTLGEFIGADSQFPLLLYLPAG